MDSGKGESYLSNANMEEKTNCNKPKEEILQNKQNFGKHIKEDHISLDDNSEYRQGGSFVRVSPIQSVIKFRMKGRNKE